jgi:DNA-binding NarL/FixJ family response regulator
MSTTEPIRILCVEDHPVFREGLEMTLVTQPDMVLVAQAANAAEAVQEFRKHRPNHFDGPSAPGANGVEALVSIRGQYPQARVIMLTTADGDAEIQRALEAGASAYLLKSTPEEGAVGNYPRRSFGPSPHPQRSRCAPGGT